MLSQSEIDALLSGTIELDQKDGQDRVNLAELMDHNDKPAADKKQAGTIQPYNFWSPDRFSKEQMRAVELVHEDLTDRLTTSLPTFLRTNVRSRLVHMEQGRFHDFISDFPSNSLLHLITMAPLPSQIVFTLSQNMCYMVLEQRLGGKIEGNSRERPLTDIDQSLLRGLVEHMLGDIKAAWSKVVTIEPTLEDSTTNHHWVQMVLGNERVMLLTFELNIQGISGSMSIFIPFTTLKPIASVLNPHIWISGRKEQQMDPMARETVMENAYRIKMPITVILGNSDMKFRNILNLSVGDVIRLNTPITDTLVIKAGDKDQFRGRIGKSGKHLKVQITSIIQDEKKPE